MTTQRQARVQELIKEEVSDILRRELKDPRLGFVTVTDAEVTADLRHAKVFVSIMGSDEEKTAGMAVLKRAEHFVRQSLGRRISIKVLPEIDFRRDDSAERGAHMMELLEQIKHDDDTPAS